MNVAEIHDVYKLASLFPVIRETTAIIMNSPANEGKQPDSPNKPAVAAFVLPLLIWIGITGFGLWREQAAGEAEFSRRLESTAAAASETVEAAIGREKAEWAWAEVGITPDGEVTGSCWFNETPPPGDESPEYSRFVKGEFEDLVNMHPGYLTPGGLPLGPMAAFQQLLRAKDDGVARQRAETVRELCFAFPSVISPELLERTDEEMSRRGLADSSLPSWRERWNRVTRVSRAVNLLMASTLPPSGVNVLDLDGEFWRVEVRKEREAVRIGLVPLDAAIREVADLWKGIPENNVTHLSLVSSTGILIAPPRDSSDWPTSSWRLEDESLEIAAFGDPSAAFKAALFRIGVLGSGCIFAAALLSVSWWRQRSVANLQTHLARQKDDFLSTVSHELRTPAASIHLLAENLAAGTVNDDESIQVYHQRLLQESGRLVATTEHLLDFSLMERGFKQYRFQPLDTGLLAEDVRHALAPASDARTIELVVDADHFESPPYGDFESLRRAIVNLGDNAIKFSPRSSRVEIRMEYKSPDRWIIHVRDQGPGVSKEDQNRIFERFYRGGNVLDRDTRGAGIGLAVVKRIVESHGGSVELTGSSREGSVFTCVLPLRPAQSGSSDENSADRG